MRRLFEIGSEITIRSDLKESLNISFDVNAEMEKYAGKKSKIVDIENGSYSLEIDNKNWSWNIAMFAEFQLILEKHKKWLNNDSEGERADLSNTDLRYADLSNADLSNTDLRYTNLRYAKLSNAKLSNTDLRYADLSNADLSNADLRYTNLRYAKLSNAKLSNAKNVNIPIACPEKGSFIGFKKANYTFDFNVIVELLILDDSKRSSATTRKCRCSKAKVLSITSLDGKENYKKAISKYDSDFVYEVGKIVEVKDYDEDRWNECSTGIHFFITRQEAVDY